MRGPWQSDLRGPGGRRRYFLGFFLRAARFGLGGVARVFFPSPVGGESLGRLEAMAAKYFSTSRVPIREGKALS